MTRFFALVLWPCCGALFSSWVGRWLLHLQGLSRSQVWPNGWKACQGSSSFNGTSLMSRSMAGPLTPDSKIVKRCCALPHFEVASSKQGVALTKAFRQTQCAYDLDSVAHSITFGQIARLCCAGSSRLDRGLWRLDCSSETWLSRLILLSIRLPAVCADVIAPLGSRNTPR